MRGTAGSTAAALLQREGFNLSSWRSELFPRFVIGESLLPHCMDLLQEAGLLENVVAPGTSCRKTVRFSTAAARPVTSIFARLPPPAGRIPSRLQRGDFDQTLADGVAARGVEILYGHGVTAPVSFDDAQATVTIEPRRMPHRDSEIRSGLQRLQCALQDLDLERPSPFPVREALFTHVTGDQPTGREGKIWACQHPDGRGCGSFRFPASRTVAAPEFFARYPVAPRGPTCALRPSDPSAGPLRARDPQFSTFPAKNLQSLCGETIVRSRFALAGNATEFLDPIFSSGVTLALASPSRAAKVLIRQLRGEAPEKSQPVHRSHDARHQRVFGSVRRGTTEHIHPDLLRGRGEPRNHAADLFRCCRLRGTGPIRSASPNRSAPRSSARQNRPAPPREFRAMNYFQRDTRPRNPKPSASRLHRSCPQVPAPAQIRIARTSPAQRQCRADVGGNRGGRCGTRCAREGLDGSRSRHWSVLSERRTVRPSRNSVISSSATP